MCSITPLNPPKAYYNNLTLFVSDHPDVGDVCDWLPAALASRHGLMTLARALREVHFPTSVAAAGRARRRLAYDELLCLQLAMLCRQSVELSGVEPVSHVTSGPHMDALLAALPFSLTDEQRAA